MSGNVRDPNMKRINSRELADAFIEQQIKEIKAQVGDKKVLLALMVYLEKVKANKLLEYSKNNLVRT